MTPLLPRDIRVIYKTIADRRILDTIQHYGAYVEWLENQLANSNFNTIEGLEQVVEFKDYCHVCEKPTYSKMHQICKNPECFCYVFKDHG